MEELQDKSGVRYGAREIGPDAVQLFPLKYPELSHIYKKSFIEDAIANGILLRGGNHG